MESSELKIFITLTSVCLHSQIRQSWRKMGKQWNERKSEQTGGVYIMFLLGYQQKADQNEKRGMPAVEQESKIFGDILQVQIIESYYNNTLKVLSLYMWMHQTCRNARFLLKVDDDVYVNFELLMQDVVNYSNSRRHQYAQIGVKDRRPGVQRNQGAKQYIPGEVFPLKRFEFDYVYGFAALTPTPLMSDALAVALCLRGIFIDDVYMNGFIPHILGAPVVHWPSLNVDIIKQRPNSITWQYITQYSITPELSIAEISRLFREETATMQTANYRVEKG